MRAAGTSESHVDSQSVDECVVGDSAVSRSDELNIRSDIQPASQLEIVEGFHTGAILRVKDGSRNRTKLVAGANVVPADAPIVTAIAAQWAVTA